MKPTDGLIDQTECTCCTGTGLLTRLNGAAYRAHRIATGQPAAAIARKAKITPADLCHIEMGRRQPTAAMRTRLLVALFSFPRLALDRAALDQGEEAS